LLSHKPWGTGRASKREGDQGFQKGSWKVTESPWTGVTEKPKKEEGKLTKRKAESHEALGRRKRNTLQRGVERGRSKNNTGRVRWNTKPSGEEGGGPQKEKFGQHPPSGRAILHGGGKLKEKKKDEGRELQTPKGN